MNLRSLLYQAKEGNILAQSFIYEQYTRKMFLLCLRYIKPDAEAEEVMMNGFLKIFTKLNEFIYINDRASEAWMRTIMTNECILHLRNSNSYLNIVDDNFPDIQMDENIFSGLAIKEIYKYIVQLPDGYRTVFNLFEFENMSHKQIAQLLGIEPATCYTQLHKARKMLKDLITKNNKEYEGRIKK